MKRTFATGLALVACMSVLAGCDNKPAAPETTEPAAVASPPPPPPPPTAATVLAGVDLDGLCSLFNRAVLPKKKITRGECVPAATASDVSLTTKDASSSLTAPLAMAGTTITLSTTNASAVAVEDATHGGLKNVGAVFVGEGGAKGICMSAEAFAPDGKNNSVFVARVGDKDPAVFRLTIDPAKLASTTFPEPVIAAGKTSAFAVLRREPGVAIKSVTFSACP